MPVSRIQRQQVLIQAGDSELASDVLMPDIFSPRNSRNVRALKIGEIETIDGYLDRNAASLITSTNGQNMAVTGIWHYRDAAGNRRQILVGDDGVDEVEVFHSTNDGVAWTRLRTLGATAVGRTPDGDQLGDNFFITFGSGVAVQVYNGSTCVDAGQTVLATLTSLTVLSQSGGLNGVYRYKQAEISSLGIIGPASLTSLTVAVQKARVTVAGISTSGSKGTRIFRTTGDGGVFFAVTDLLANETSFIDNLDDRSLLDRQAEVVNSGEKPPQVEFVFQHRSRAIYLDDDTVYPSDLNLGESIPPGNSFKVGQGQDQGDFNTGGSGDFRGEAIIWRERSVWRLQGDGRESWFLIRTAASAGAVSHRTTVRIPSGAKYTDEQGGGGATDRPTYFYVSYDRKMRLFFGDDDVVLSGPLQDTMDRVNYVARDKIVAFMHPVYEIVVVGLPLDSSTEINRWVGWDYTRGFYYSELSSFYPGVGSVVVAETSAISDLFLAGNTKTASNGKVYRLFTGDTDNGSDISIRIWEKPTHLGAPGILKILRHIEPWFGAQAASTLVTLSVFEGWANLGASAFQTYTFQLQASGVDMATPGQIELMATATARYAVDTAFVFQWTFTGQKKINYRGRVAGFQVLPPSESRP